MRSTPVDGSTDSSVIQQTNEISTGTPAYWLVFIVRAFPALVIAAVVTFSADHSVALGFVLFALFAATTGIIVLVGGILSPHSRLVRTFAVTHGALGAVCAVIAAGVVVVLPEASVGNLILVVAVYAAATGLVELYLGVRTRRAFAVSRDWVFMGGITTLFAVALLFIPLELRDPITGQSGIEGYLTAPVVAVGLFGAYCAIIAVYLVIAGLSLKWAPATSAAVAAERVE